MEQLAVVLNREVEALEIMKSQAEIQLKKAPEGKLNLSRSGGRIQFHRHMPNKSRVYLKKTDPLVTQLAQKDYAAKVHSQASFEIMQIKRVLSRYTDSKPNSFPQQLPFQQRCKTSTAQAAETQPTLATSSGMRTLQLQPKAQLSAIKAIFPQLKTERQTLVKPYVLPDSLFAYQWENETFESHPDSSECRLTTNRGEKVRSKSEVLIANALYQRKIPYRYEQRIYLDGAAFHPDFLLLNPATRQEIVWEHFGLTDNPDYCSNAISKIACYLRHGFILGHTLIATFESSSQPLDTTAIDNAINPLFGPGSQ